MIRPPLTPQRPFRAVTFDVGGTLIEPWPSVGHVYSAVAAEFGVQCPPQELNDGFTRAWKARGDFDYSRAQWYDLVRRAFGAEAGRLPEEFFSAVYQRFAEPPAWRVFDDVAETFDELRSRGIRLAAVSNWDERIHPLLDTLGLRPPLEFVVASVDAGAAKPSPEIFRCGLERLGLDASEVLHVGDSWHEDVEGARAAGMRAALVDRGGRQPAKDANLRGLRQILSLAGD